MIGNDKQQLAAFQLRSLDSNRCYDHRFHLATSMIHAFSIEISHSAHPHANLNVEDDRLPCWFVSNQVCVSVSLGPRSLLLDLFRDAWQLRSPLDSALLVGYAAFVASSSLDSIV
jgi:hypothetical protein